MNTNDDRLRLARRMRIPNTIGWDPFTDANDDYAVLEWMRDEQERYRDTPGTGPDVSWHFFLDIDCRHLTTYQVGDIAQAAIRAFERA